MRNVMAFVYFVLSLFGWIDRPGNTLVARSSEDGVETLLSQTRVASGTVRFECLRSASGHCHYAVFAGRCASSAPPAGVACMQRPAGTFDVSVGQARERSDLPADFRLCVSHRDGAVDADCRPARQ
ncbi:MAG TPA: hypothetical protein VIT62_07885 [Lysobacter sp.]